MHGNVEEWCSDWFSFYFYARSPIDDPTGPATAPEQLDSRRVARGGGAALRASQCRSAVRMEVEERGIGGETGFRVVMVPPAKQTPVSSPEISGITNSIGMKFKLIPADEFMMGIADATEDLIMAFPGTKPEWFEDERPQHRVRIAKPFCLGVTEVTQEQYQKVMGKNPSWFSRTGKGAGRVKGMDTSSFPVENVSQEDAVEFCRKLTALDGRAHRLPTEAEWEYACRAGTVSRWCFGDDLGHLWEYAWAGHNAFDAPQPAAQKKPNAWGLYDMHGNVMEWCSDWYCEDYYVSSPEDNPAGPAVGSLRVVRGGSFSVGAKECRAASRSWELPTFRFCDLGFRVVLDVEPGNGPQADPRKAGKNEP